VVEADISPQVTLADELREGLLQSIAHIRLLLRGWYEPPYLNALHLSTLIQQLLSLIAQYGGMDAAQAWSLLCGNGVFATVSKADFVTLLRELGEREILMQTADGLLLHGAVGERLVNHYSFYAAFAASDEFRLVCGSKNLGTLPLSQPIEQGSYLIFAGKRWRVKDVDLEKKLIQVTAARGGKVPMFLGDSGSVDDGVRQDMRQILAGAGPIPFLDATAGQLLAEARAAYFRLGLDKNSVVLNDSHALLFPWQGDRIMAALELMLKAQGLEARNLGLYLLVNAPPKNVLTTLRQLAASPPPEAAVLVKPVLNKWLEKWDHLLPSELLAKNYAAYRVDVLGAHQTIRQLVQDKL
jgi:ATP-dependent Lhr-like helicase